MISKDLVHSGGKNKKSAVVSYCLSAIHGGQAAIVLGAGLGEALIVFHLCLTLTAFLDSKVACCISSHRGALSYQRT